LGYDHGKKHQADAYHYREENTNLHGSPFLCSCWWMTYVSIYQSGFSSLELASAIPEPNRTIANDMVAAKTARSFMRVPPLPVGLDSEQGDREAAAERHHSKSQRG